MKQFESNGKVIVALGRPGETGIARLEQISRHTYRLLREDTNLRYASGGLTFLCAGDDLIVTADGWEQRDLPDEWLEMLGLSAHWHGLA